MSIKYIYILLFILTSSAYAQDDTTKYLSRYDRKYMLDSLTIKDKQIEAIIPKMSMTSYPYIELSVDSICGEVIISMKTIPSLLNWVLDKKEDHYDGYFLLDSINVIVKGDWENHFDKSTEKVLIKYPNLNPGEEHPLFLYYHNLNNNPWFFILDDGKFMQIDIRLPDYYYKPISRNKSTTYIEEAIKFYKQYKGNMQKAPTYTHRKTNKNNNWIYPAVKIPIE